MIGVTSGQRPGVGAIGFNLTILGKHQTHLQDSGAKKSDKNKKDQRNNLKHHEKVYQKPPSIYPNVIGTCIVQKMTYIIDITACFIILKALILY